MIYYVIGPSGGGKSTLAEYILKALPRSFHISLDEICKGEEGNWQKCSDVISAVQNLPQGKNVYLVDIGAGTQHHCMPMLIDLLKQCQKQVILVTADPAVAKINDPCGSDRKLEDYINTEFTAREELNSIASFKVDRSSLPIEKAGDLLLSHLRTTRPSWLRKLEISLVGIRHTYQWDKSNPITSQFITYLEQLTQGLETDLIAEEWSTEASQLNGIDKSNVEDLAKRLNIEYCNFDSSTKEREILGLNSTPKTTETLHMSLSDKEIDIEELMQETARTAHRANFTQREAIWLAKLEDTSRENIIAICGSEHLDSFSKLIEREGYNVTILHSFD